MACNFDKFFFRTATENQASGIMYLALSADSYGSFMCRGGRQVGVADDGQTIWYIAGNGGYSDMMPESAMMNQQMASDMEETPNAKQFMTQNGIHLKGKISLFSDGRSYWLVDDELLDKKKGKSRSRSRSTNKNSKGKGKRGQSKGKKSGAANY